MTKSTDIDFSIIDDLGSDAESYLQAKYDGIELERLRTAVRRKVSQNVKEARKRMEVVACLRGIDYAEEGTEAGSENR